MITDLNIMPLRLININMIKVYSPVDNEDIEYILLPNNLYLLL